jgi:pyridoxine 5-phosphate synthase
LDYNNVKEIVKIPGIEELNIGFSVIARAMVVGMRQAVAEMKEAIG